MHNLDQENPVVLPNHLLGFKSIVNPISKRSSYQVNPIFLIIFTRIIVQKEGPAPSGFSLILYSPILFKNSGIKFPNALP